MRRHLKFIVSPYWKILTVALAGVAAGSLADVFEPWPLKIAFDSVLGSKPAPAWFASVAAAFGAGPSALIAATAGLVLLIAGLGAAGSYVQKYLTTSVAERVARDLRHVLYHHLERLSLAFYDRQKLGELLSRLTTDVDAVQAFVSDAMLGVAVNVLTLGGMLAVMVYLDWRFALVALAVTPPLAAVAFGFTSRIKQSARDVRKKESEIVSLLEATLSSIRVVQAYSRERYEELRLDRAGDENVQLALRARSAKALLASAVEVIAAGGTCLVLSLGLERVLRGDLTAGSLLVFLAYVGNMYKPLRELAKMADTLSKTAVGLERIDEVLAVDEGVPEADGAVPAPRFKGEIEVDCVSFAYAAGRPALDRVSFAARPGQVVGIVGPSGSGKSTLAQLIPRLYDATSGSIRIDGVDVRDYTLASLREQVSYVFQESVLFHDTIFENIGYGRPGATREEILRAATIANVHAFVERMPDGYDTVVGDRGVSLSGGQRQRIAIARAIVRDAPILILDEPSSGLDSSSERLVFEALERLMAGRTSILITHRLETLDLADVVFVLEDGRIVERGSPSELLKASGVFSELYWAHRRSA